MGLPKAKESRRHKRFDVRRLPGALLNAATQDVIACEPVDVSKGGMGIVSAEWVLPQVDLILVVGDKSIDLEIVWGIERRAAPTWARKSTDTIHKQVFRYGLKVAKNNCDLAALFEKEGCFE